MPLVGGAPREVMDNVEWADWSPDGITLAIVRQEQGRHRLEFPAGKLLYEADGWIGHIRISPKATSSPLLTTQLGDDGGAVAVVDLAGKRRLFPPAGTVFRESRGRRQATKIWFTATRTGGDRSLYAVDLSGNITVAGARSGRTDRCSMLKETEMCCSRAATIAPDMIGSPRASPKERDLSWLDWSTPGDLSADGRTVLFAETGEGGGPKYAVYLRKTDNSPAIRLSEGIGHGVVAGWKVGARATQYSLRRR